MTILDTIIAQKRIEVALSKNQRSMIELENSDVLHRQPLSLESFILQPERNGIIAEFKRKSPSKGIINDRADVLQVTSAYCNGGASCISVLTDKHFFGGDASDFQMARANPIPLLRKDFMIDPYQILESKLMGADVVLLIAACLSVSETLEMSRFAHSLGLSILLELHDEKELDHVNEYINIVGINNRNLKTFEVDIEKSISMAEKLGKRILKVAESGISKPEDVIRFKDYGFDAFLIGENFMKHEDPGLAFHNFVNEIKVRS